MHGTLAHTDQPAPPEHSAAFGRLRVAALRARLLGLPGAVPAAAAPALREWAEGFAPADALGLDPAGMPDDRRDALAWAGMPLARGGALAWGRELREDAVAAPTLAGATLVVPPPERLLALSSIALKPLRAFVERACGVRLQAGAGIHCFLWPDQALLVSCAEVPLGGFLHGPGPGQRSTVALDPGGFQALRW
jgi:hypothetical protein